MSKANRKLIFILAVLVIIFSAFAAAKHFGLVKNTSDNSSGISDDGGSGLYDTKPISDAYLSGDFSQLSDFHKEIYNKACDVIGEIISDDMTDYEKELAVHDYIIIHTRYDEVFLGALSGHSENSDNPYGALINGKAICSGYTTTFQMFMDMLEIPCKSILSTDFTGEEHAWNMVETDGKWYYTDVTWDDPTPDCDNRPVRHKYFNVTEDFMKIKHSWDSSDLPKAEGGENSYIAKNLVSVSDFSQILALMENAYNNMNEDIYLYFDEHSGINLSEEDGTDDYWNVKRNCPELYDVFSEFKSRYTNTEVLCQRIKYDGKIILAVYMKKTK